MRERGSRRHLAQVYSIDETGTLSALLAEKTDGSVALSKENLASLKNSCRASARHSPTRISVKSMIQRIPWIQRSWSMSAWDTLKNLDSAISELGGNFTQVRSDVAGVVSYSMDSMETLTLKPGDC